MDNWQLKKFLFLVTSWMEGGTVRHNFERDPPKDHACQVWFNLVQGFQRRRFKCESLRRTTTNAKWWQKPTWPLARWAKKECIKNYDAILLSKYDSAKKKGTKLCLRVEKWSRSYNIFFLFLHKACWILLFV